jgi:hypothetical protein
MCGAMMLDVNMEYMLTFTIFQQSAGHHSGQQPTIKQPYNTQIL